MPLVPIAGRRCPSETARHRAERLRFLPGGSVAAFVQTRVSDGLGFAVEDSRRAQHARKIRGRVELPAVPPTESLDLALQSLQRRLRRATLLVVLERQDLTEQPMGIEPVPAMDQER